MQKQPQPGSTVESAGKEDARDGGQDRSKSKNAARNAPKIPEKGPAAGDPVIQKALYSSWQRIDD